MFVAQQIMVIAFAAMTVHPAPPRRVLLEQEFLEAPQVVRGVVVAATQPSETSDDFRVVSTVRVDEVLKGKAQSEVVVLLPSGWHGSAEGMDSAIGAEVVLCLRPAAGTFPDERIAWRVAALFSLNRAVPGRFPFDAAAMTIDCKPLNSRREFLEAAREICADLSPVRGWMDVGLSETGPGFLPFGMVRQTRLPVPLTARTRQRALQWTQSRDPQRHVAAAEVLARFPDAASVAALKALLSDSASVDMGRGAGHWRWYYVREQALTSLRELKQAVPAPPLEENWADYWRLCAIAWIVPLCALTTLIAICWLVSRRVPQGFRSAWIGFVFAFFLSALLACQKHRSYFVVDEIILSRGSCHRLASFCGILQYTVIESWDDSGDLKVGSFPCRSSLFAIPEGDKMIARHWGLGDSTKSPPADALDLFDQGKRSLEADRKVTATHRFGAAAVATGITGNPRGGVSTFHTVRLPIDWLLMSVIIPPALYLLKTWRRRGRSRRWKRDGHCQHCGYDLRNAESRCPECGTAWNVPTQALQAQRDVE